MRRHATFEFDGGRLPPKRATARSSPFDYMKRRKRFNVNGSGAVAAIELLRKRSRR